MLRPRRLKLAIAGILLLVLVGLSPSAPSRGADLLGVFASAWGRAAGPGTVAAVLSGAPRIDDNGFAVWGGPVAGNWCVPLSNIIKYPIDLGGQDPTTLDETSLDLVFDEGYMWFEAPIDPVWTVNFNGQAVGTISGPWYHPFERIWNAVSIPIDPSLIVDGENDVYLSNPEPPVGELGAPGCQTCRRTCVNLATVELKGKVEFDIVPDTRSPKPDAKNVEFRKDKLDIQVEFTRPVSKTTLNKDTFRVYFWNNNIQEVYVDGDVKVDPQNMMSARFVPKTDLRDGIEYHVRIVGEDGATEEDPDRWVHSSSGDSLEEGYEWSFWTMPNLQVKLVPVQVIEQAHYNDLDIPVHLVAGKPTALKVFVRWDRKPDVAEISQLDDIELYDVRVLWKDWWYKQGEVGWRQSGGVNWLPVDTSKSPALKRKREYREYVGDDESYTKFEKRKSKDSVTFTRFYPPPISRGKLAAIVELKNDKGVSVEFPSEAVPYSSLIHSEWNTYFRPLRVGSWTLRTTPVNLEPVARTSRSGIRALFPVAYVRPFGGSLSSVDLPFNRGVADRIGQLGEMNRLCYETDGCSVMFGVVPEDFMGENGLVFAEYATPWWMGGISIAVDRFRRAALLNYRIATDINKFRFIAAHESGHLQDQLGADWDDQDPPVPATDGFDVVAKEDRRRSVALLPGKPTIPLDYTNFMNADPFESYGYIWIRDGYYTNLRERFWTGTYPSSVASQSTTALPRVMVSGSIISPTKSVTLDPFYLLPPGDWSAPSVSGTFSLAFLNAAGATLASYPFIPSFDGPTSNRAGFDFVVPFPTGTTRVQIKYDGSVIKDVTASANAPAVNVTAPAAGNNWSGTRSVTWDASDADGNALRYAVQVSADNGAHWQAVATDITQTVLLWDTRGITNTAQAMVRVMATDGLRSTAATAGPFTVSNPPTVTLASPSIGITNAHTFAPIILAFSDDMAPASLTTGTITLRGPSPAPLSGVITYDAPQYEATFIPAAELAYATSYTVTVTTAVKARSGPAIPASVSFSFRTEDDPYPPTPVAFTPGKNQWQVPLNTKLAVVWDKALNPATMTNISFTLATTSGVPVAGTVAYAAASRTATFAPLANLAPHTMYSATLKAGIRDLAGNATTSDYRWLFRTGGDAVSSPYFTRAFADYAPDDNADGLYDRLIIRVGVQVTAAASYSLTGVLADANGEKIAQVSNGFFLQPGVQFVDLAFPGGAIGGHGMDGPFTLTGLLLYKANDLRVSARLDDAYRTSAYASSRFYARLTFSGLPDVNLLPGTSRHYAFNVRDYARHVSLQSNQLTYSITMYAAGEAGVTLSSDGYIHIHPWRDWTGSSRVTVQAGAGNDVVADTFEVNVGWQYKVYLPLVLKGFDGSSSSPSRSNWKTPLVDDFESGFPNGWAVWSVKHWLPDDTLRWFNWGTRNCLAYSGSYSGWPFGGDVPGQDPDGSSLPCGANYPNGYEGFIGNRANINLKYAGAAEFRMKVWTNLDQGDSICAVAATDLSDIQDKDYFGVCKTGQSQGWEDLVLDLANVPTLGNLLGGDKVWVAVEFRTDNAGTRPNGAFVDDVTLRICPAGLTCR